MYLRPLITIQKFTYTRRSHICTSHARMQARAIVTRAAKFSP
jgi:hypothetical protein